MLTLRGWRTTQPTAVKGVVPAFRLRCRGCVPFQAFLGLGLRVQFFGFRVKGSVFLAKARSKTTVVEVSASGCGVEVEGFPFHPKFYLEASTVLRKTSGLGSYGYGVGHKALD